MDKQGTQRPIKVCADCPQYVAVKRVTKRDWHGKCGINDLPRNEFTAACDRPDWQMIPVAKKKPKPVVKKGNP